MAAPGLLAGCNSTVQTGSGASYLAARPEFRPAAGNSVERAVYDAAKAEPALRFPARLGLARIEGGRLTAIPPEEGDKWLALIKSVGTAYGEFVPISPLVAEMASAGRQDDTVVDRIRIGAARQQMDVVLIYEVLQNQRDRGTVLSLADLTIVGSFLVPSRAIEGQPLRRSRPASWSTAARASVRGDLAGAAGWTPWASWRLTWAAWWPG